MSESLVSLMRALGSSGTEQACRIGVFDLGKGLEGGNDRKQIVGKGWLYVGETLTRKLNCLLC